MSLIFSNKSSSAIKFITASDVVCKSEISSSIVMKFLGASFLVFVKAVPAIRF